jgi:hypothetical protein
VNVGTEDRRLPQEFKGIWDLTFVEGIEDTVFGCRKIYSTRQFLPGELLDEAKKILPSYRMRDVSGSLIWMYEFGLRKSGHALR